MTCLRRIAVVEAWTLILLFGVAMPLKYLGGLEQATQIIAPIHGLTFTVFIWFVIRSWSEGLIDRSGAFRLVVGAHIPGVGFMNERWLRKQSHEVPDAL